MALVKFFMFGCFWTFQSVNLVKVFHYMSGVCQQTLDQLTIIQVKVRAYDCKC